MGRCLSTAPILLLFVSGALGHEDPYSLPLPPLRLTISSLFRESPETTELIDRELQVHWSPQVATVSLYNQDPTSNPKPVEVVETRRHPEGWLETRLRLGSQILPGGWELEAETDVRMRGDHCLPLWASAHAPDGSVLSADCIKIRPTWMHDHKPILGGLSISDLLIPGTHNSGCYKRGDSLSPRDTTATARYLLTQDQDIWSQLVYGVRYLDLRIGYYPFRRNGSEIPVDNSLWVNHDLIRIRPLLGVLREVRKFLEAAKDEVVILDIHRLPVGFSGRPARHEHLIGLLKRELGDLAFPRESATPNWPSLNAIWETSARIIITYPDKTMLTENNWLWPAIKQLWANAHSGRELEQFLNTEMTLDERREGPWAAMAHLTPRVMDVIFQGSQSIRNLAHEVNRELVPWLSPHWRRANIIATDFFLENDIINFVVQGNHRKGTNATQYWLE